MTDHEIMTYCKEKFEQHNELLKEFKIHSSKVSLIEGSLGYLVKTVDSVRASDWAVKSSLIGIVFAILVQIGGFLYLWGRLNYNVEENTRRIISIEEIHPRLITK